MDAQRPGTWLKAKHTFGYKKLYFLISLSLSNLVKFVEKKEIFLRQFITARMTQVPFLHVFIHFSNPENLCVFFEAEL